MPNLEAPVAVCVGGSYYDESTAVGRSNLMRMNYPGVVGRGERVLRNLIERQLFLGNYRRSLGDDVGRRSAVVLGMAWAWAWPAGRVT